LTWAQTGWLEGTLTKSIRTLIDSVNRRTTPQLLRSPNEPGVAPENGDQQQQHTHAPIDHEALENKMLEGLGGDRHTRAGRFRQHAIAESRSGGLPLPELAHRPHHCKLDPAEQLEIVRQA